MLGWLLLLKQFQGSGLMLKVFSQEGESILEVKVTDQNTLVLAPPWWRPDRTGYLSVKASTISDCEISSGPVETERSWSMPNALGEVFGPVGLEEAAEISEDERRFYSIEVPLDLMGPETGRLVTNCFSRFTSTDMVVERMNFQDPAPLSLDGSLLLADPSLMDSNFKRAVLYLNHHSAEAGAEGFILNRPAHKKVGDLSLGTNTPELDHVPVYVGGPVGTDHLIFASIHWLPEEKRLEFDSRLSASAAVARVSEGFHVVAFIGHSGWSAGQLEGEILERAWITHRPEGLPFTDNSTSLWKDTLEGISPWHYLLALTPDDPSLN
jgi:putative transcriptional regulator